VYSSSRCIFITFVFCFSCFSIFVLFSFYFVSFLRFCGYIFCEPSRDLTRPLGRTKWFKGLVAYAKCHHDSYESELGLSVSFLFLVLLKNEQKEGVGAFVRLLFDPIFSSYLIPFSYSFYVKPS